MIQRYAQFWFFRKWSGNSFFSIFWVWFFRKMFLVLYFINWPSFIVWLPLVLEMLDNMSIWIVCFPGCDVIDFEINLIFQIKPFSYITKTSKQKVKYLENKKRNKKHFFVIFTGLSIARNCLRHENATINWDSKNPLKRIGFLPKVNKLADLLNTLSFRLAWSKYLQYDCQI